MSYILKRMIRVGDNEFHLLKKLLDDNDIEYRLHEHKHVYTSEHVARVRGIELKTGVKSLLLKVLD